MLSFQKFQHEMARHLRDPHHTPRPFGVPAGRMAVYNELLFTNICGFIDSCFPVCRQLLGEGPWRRLCRTFYRDWRSHTPWFREIPGEFVRYLSEHAITQPLPRWLADLARYEWAELVVDVADVALPEHDPLGDLMLAPVLLNPARVDVVSEWPVHRMECKWQKRKAETTFLIVFRDARCDVKFTEINAITAHVIRLLESGLTGQQTFAELAKEMGHPDPDALQGFGQALLISLREQGVLLGTRT